MENMWDIIENAILTFFCTAFPVLFTIFCFPVVLLLRCSKDFCYFWFSYIFPVLAGRLKRHFGDVKKIMFRDLISDPNKDMTILEVGIGHGANFSYYPKGCKLIALDINPYFGVDLKKALMKYPGIKVDQMVIGGAEDLSQFNDSSVDVIICTHVLCSVNDPIKACKEMARVLKVGGKLYVMEHIASRTSTIVGALQWAIEPFWTPLTGGCKMTRDPINELKLSGLKGVDNLKYVNMVKIPFILGPHLFGVCSK